jgi:hypothetical protein
MIPDYLAAYPWYAPHLAYLSAAYGAKHTTDAEPACAVVPHGDFRDAYLQGAYLRDASFRSATFTRANLVNTDLRDVDFYFADLTGADLEGSDLTGVNLQYAILHGVKLRDATGIAQIGPVGRNGRIVYAVAHKDGPMIQAGCWWGTLDATCERIRWDYGHGAAAERYVAAVQAVAALVTEGL